MTTQGQRSDSATPLILCVEDEDDLRSDLVEELEEAGYAVAEARDEAQAIEQLEAVHPDLILCDINLPRGNGYDLLRKVRSEQPHLADVPFVFLTALADPREVVEGKRRGADDYLVKPVDFDLMLATVEARIRQVSAIRQSLHEQAGQLRLSFDGLRDVSTRETLDTMRRTLDYISLGIVILSGERAVVFANRAAQVLADQDDGFSIGVGLDVGDNLASRQLRKAVAIALAPENDDSMAPVAVPIPRPSGRRELLAFVSTLNLETQKETRMVGIFISDPEVRRKVPDGVLASLFGFTPAEAQVASLLADGRRADEIARLLGVSATTVAFHIRNLLGKTDTGRQADLIALLLTGPMSMSFE